jgi:hypothetical protein
MRLASEAQVANLRYQWSKQLYFNNKNSFKFVINDMQYAPKLIK